MSTRKSYPSDVSDAEWAFAAPYLALIREDAGQRAHRLREVFNALRWLVRTGARWRYLPGDFPPWEAVYQQARRRLGAGVFEAMAHDLRAAGIRLEVVKHTEAKRGFVLLPRRWVVERTFAWAAGSRRLARDYERLAGTLAGWHWLVLMGLMLHRATLLTAQGS
jgi:transposase